MHVIPLSYYKMKDDFITCNIIIYHHVGHNYRIITKKLLVGAIIHVSLHMFTPAIIKYYGSSHDNIVIA